MPWNSVCFFHRNDSHKSYDFDHTKLKQCAILLIWIFLFFREYVTYKFKLKNSLRTPLECLREKKQLESVNSNASHHKHEISTQNTLEALKHIANSKQLSTNWNLKVIQRVPWTLHQTCFRYKTLINDFLFRSIKFIIIRRLRFPKN